MQAIHSHYLGEVFIVAALRLAVLSCKMSYVFFCNYLVLCVQFEFCLLSLSEYVRLIMIIDSGRENVLP
jgi:hypothetical protein